MKIIINYFVRTLLGIAVMVLLLLIYFNLPVKNNEGKVGMGVTFSYRYATDIGLNWKENYVAMLDDLGVKKVRIPVYWDDIEKKEGEYDFSKVDWQLDEAQKRNAEVILAVGQKVPRWPECFIPEWAKNDDQKRKDALLREISHVVKRYKKHPAVRYWQVENEPFLKFGICPPLDVNLLDQEIALVRTLDPLKKVIITDSGELSLWINAAKRADIFGTTLYRTIWKKEIGYFSYPIGPRFFHFKRWLIRNFADQENAFVIELQGEPWIAGLTTDSPLNEQFKSMEEGRLSENVQFAKNAGFSDVYLWGVEWWYWLKIKKDYPALWETAGNIFRYND